MKKGIFGNTLEFLLKKRYLLNLRGHPEVLIWKGNVLFKIDFRYLNAGDLFWLLKSNGEIAHPGFLQISTVTYPTKISEVGEHFVGHISQEEIEELIQKGRKKIA